MIVVACSGDTSVRSPAPVSPSAATGATATSVGSPRRTPSESNQERGSCVRTGRSREPARSPCPDVAGDATLPLLIWHAGSGWEANDVKDGGAEVAIVDEFTARGYAVASMSIRSSSDARFPAQGFDVRAAIRYLRENAATYGVDPGRFAFMGDSSGGWATAFAATTGDTRELDGETGVDGTSSAVQVAVPFFPPTDFLSMDEFAAANNLPMEEGIYPFDSPMSPVGLLVQCPGEGRARAHPIPAP